MTYLQAIVIALVQGVTELFPVSSLGHSVLVPAWIGGSWETLVTQSSQADSASSFYLAYIVALHCATALALLWFFRADWVRIIRGFFQSVARSIRERTFIVRNADERLAWLIVLATIPVGITGLALEHVFRTVFAKPLAASIFLFINGLILLLGERARRSAEEHQPATRRRRAGRRDGVPRRRRGRGAPARRRRSRAGSGGSRSADDVEAAVASDRRIAGISYRDGLSVGSLQVLALLPGISRSGITMVGGLWRGLSHEDAARFAFLLATPGHPRRRRAQAPEPRRPGRGPHPRPGRRRLVVTGITAYFSVRYLVRYFETRTLTPFAIYCLIAGAASIVRFA